MRGPDTMPPIPDKSHFIQDLKPGEWNHVMFEIPHLKRDKVTVFEINQMLKVMIRKMRELLHMTLTSLNFSVLKQISLKDGMFLRGNFHSAILVTDRAIIKSHWPGKDAGKNFQLIDNNNNVVYSGEVLEVDNINGKFNQLDFSDFHEPGKYQIHCGDLLSDPFPIDEDIWLQSGI